MADDYRPEPCSFYQLLDSDPVATLNHNINKIETPDFSESFYGPNPPKMLCFGGYKKEEEAICSEITAATIKQMVSPSDSSSASSATNTSSSANPNRKRNGSGQNPAKGSVGLAGAPAESKRARSEKATAHAKPRARPARKEKIGERISTLQQLVSPFGKTDTASVLQETMCYIKFLHEQVQVLCSPYLKSSPYQITELQGPPTGLRARGLCLVPVACTAQVASANGADLWAPAGPGACDVSCSIGSSKH